MFRLFLSHLHYVTLGYFNVQLTLLLSTRYRLHKLDIYIQSAGEIVKNFKILV